MATYACHNPKCRGAEYVECWKPPSRLNGFFIWTSIIIHVHIESKVNSWILGYGLVAGLCIPENLINPSSQIFCKSSIQFTYIAQQFILLIN